MPSSLAFIVSAIAAVAVSATTAPPPAKVVPFIQTFYGTMRSDPYHWMESGGPDFDEYLDGQSTYTQALLAANPGRPHVLQALRDIDTGAGSATSTSGTVRVENRILYLQSLPGSSAPSLLAREDGKSNSEVLVNAAVLLQNQVIAWFEPSPRGTKIAYGVTASSEAVTIHVCDADGLHDTTQAIAPNVIPDVTWRDERTFYYSTVVESATDRTETSYLHSLGSKKGQDTAIAGFGAHGPMGSQSDRHLFVTYIVFGTDEVIAMPQRGVTPHESVFVAPFSKASQANAPWRRVFDEDDEVVRVAIAGRYLYGLSDRGDARRTIVMRDRGSGAYVRTIVPQGEGFRTDIYANRTGLYVAKRVGAEMQLERYDLEGRFVAAVTLPETSSTLSLQGDPAKNSFTFETASFNDPGRWFEISGPQATVTDAGISPPPPAAYANLRFEDAFATRSDGTKVPYTVVYTVGTPKDGNRPTLAVGYGAYGFDIEPPLPPFVVAALKLGVVVVLVHARGGGEFGEPWHLAGKGPTKQNTIDDFVAGAQAAITDGWTSHAKLAGIGVSAGGITIGGAVTQHPDLFSVAISQVGFSDMVDLENMPNGPGNVPEFGSVKTVDGFHDLLAMSAYDHVTTAPYPAMIFTTGLSDRRTAPWQVAKMAARLQASTTSGRPILLRSDSQGHGVIRVASAEEEEYADVFTFMLWQLGEPGFVPQ
jgi:prolyl oligopeptidase